LSRCILLTSTGFDTALIDISPHEIHKDITLIASDRRRRITLKKDVLQTASVSTRMFGCVLNKFFYGSGEIHQPVESALEQSCFLEVTYFHFSRTKFLKLSNAWRNPVQGAVQSIQVWQGNQSVIASSSLITPGPGYS